VSGGTGNWDSTTNWAATSGGASGASFPVAGDVVAFDSLSGNANMTVNVASACASLIMSGTYAGTLTYTSTLTLTSTYTSVAACTIAGTAGTLILNTGGQTITSGGKTLTCALTFGTNATYTLADNWTVNGLVSAGTGSFGTTINGSSKTLTCAGGFHQTGTTSVVSGTAKLVLTGGTWDSAASGNTLSNAVDLAGNVTVSGALTWGSSTLRYLSGVITTTGSTLSITSGSTLDTSGVTWNSVTLAAGATHTLTSALAWGGTLTLNTGSMTITGAALSGTGGVTVQGTGTITLNNTGGLVTTGTLTLPNTACTFAGTAGFTVGTLTTATLSASRIHTLTYGNTYTVTAALGNVGATATVRQALKSSSAGNKVVFTVTAGAALTLTCCDPTDIDSSAGAQVVSVGGVITTSLNWVGSVTAGAGGGPRIYF
jgi:fibronectin-binding autotransporter adhesin